MGEVYCSQSRGLGWLESQIGSKEKLWLIMKKKWAESCRTSVLLQKAARPYIQESHGAEIPPPPDGNFHSGSLATTLHRTSQVCFHTVLQYTAFHILQAWFFPCLRDPPNLESLDLGTENPTFGIWRSHQVRGCWHKGDFPAIGWEGSYWYSPLSIWTYSRCVVFFFFKDPYLLQLEFSGCSMKWKCSSTEKKIDSQSSQSAFPGG